MFSGIVEEAGTVVAVEKNDKGCRFTIETENLTEGVKLGESIANNGCCLTVVKFEGNQLVFDLLEETQKVTNLMSIELGKKINLERSLSVGDRIGGHFVTGHVDAMAKITQWRPLGETGADYELEVEVPAGLERFIVPKGCIALDGMSLTVGEVDGPRFNVWIIPHTREVTALSQREIGDYLNLEVDMLAKYVEKLTLSESLPKKD